MTSAIRLDGKTAIVTGAGRGLGAAIAHALVAAGARVIGVDVNEAGLSSQLERAVALNRQGKLTILAGDLRDPKFCRAAIDQSGGPDILVNNAALLPSYVHPGRLLAGGRKKPFWELDDDTVQAVIDVNFVAADRMACLSSGT